MLSTLAHMARARSSFTSPGACQASKLIASALEMVRRCPSAHSFLACLNTLCAHRLTCTSRVTTGQAATAEVKRAPLRPTHSALKCFDLVLSSMLLWQGAAYFFLLWPPIFGVISTTPHRLPAARCFDEAAPKHAERTPSTHSFSAQRCALAPFTMPPPSTCNGHLPYPLLLCLVSRCLASEPRAVFASGGGCPPASAHRAEVGLLPGRAGR